MATITLLLSPETSSNEMLNDPYNCNPRIPVQPLILNIPDKYAIVFAPVVAYWAYSLLFYFCDQYDLLEQYKLHTPAEFLKRNRVPVRKVVREVLIQHAMQIVMAGALAYHEPDALADCNKYRVSMLASRLRFFGNAISQSLGNASDTISSAQLGLLMQPNSFQTLQSGVDDVSNSAWNTILARFCYWLALPALQFIVACFVMDTVQYFIHITMHTYPYLYRTFHAHHHRLYVPYAFGALYNHPLEGFLEDTVGSGLAFKLAGLNIRQGIWFFTISTLKTVDDHSGYRIPWDPLQWVGENNALYHDIHHQSWGMKVRFSMICFNDFAYYLSQMNPLGRREIELILPT